MTPLCIYHGSCADGFTAAWVVWKAYGEGRVEFHAASHGDLPPAVDGREVYVVDFSYPRPAMEAMVRQATKLTVIDHHVTAAQELEGLIRSDGVVDGVFDLEKSGCLRPGNASSRRGNPHKRCWRSTTSTSGGTNCRGPENSSSPWPHIAIISRSGRR